MKLPQGYEPHELPPDYTGKLWIEGQMRQFEFAVADHYKSVLTKALTALERADKISGYANNKAAIAALKQALGDTT